MAGVRAGGTLLRTDDAGFLVPRAALEKIVPPWTEAVAALRAAVVGELGERLHSLYIRGSVAAGTALPGHSDLDAIAVLTGAGPPGDDFPWLPPLHARMEARFPFCQGVDLFFLGVEEILAEGGQNRWGFLLATQCVPVHGADLRASLPRFRPGPHAVMHAPQLQDDIDETLRDFAGEPDEAEREAWCGWIMRRIVRAGFELVMEAEGGWTRDLYPCWQAFARHHPEQGAALYGALELAVDPTGDLDRMRGVLTGIGRWVARRGLACYGDLRLPPRSG